MTGSAARSETLAYLAAFAASFLVACNAIFGFEPGFSSAIVCSSSLECAPDESCVEAKCTKGPVDDNADAAGSAVADGDGATNAEASTVDPSDGGDASDAPDAACGDVSDDPANCGGCGYRCSPSQICELGGCKNPVTYGWQGQGDPPQGVAGNAFTGIPLGAFSQPGWITKIGIVIDTPGPSAYVGIYDDDAGLPGKLVARAGGSFVTKLGLNEIDVTPPVQFGVGRYWLVMLFDATTSLAESGAAAVGWAIAPAAFGPLPDASPSSVQIPTAYIASPPNVYVVVAQ